MVRPLTLLAVLVAAPASGQPASVSSPDGRTEVTVDLDARCALTWRVDRDGAPLLRPGRLGVVLSDGDTLGVGMEVIDTATLYRDASEADWQTNATAYTIETRTVTAADRLGVRLAPSGGLAVRFAPAD